MYIINLPIWIVIDIFNFQLKLFIVIGKGLIMKTFVIVIIMVIYYDYDI